MDAMRPMHIEPSVVPLSAYLAFDANTLHGYTRLGSANIRDQSDTVVFSRYDKLARISRELA